MAKRTYRIPEELLDRLRRQAAREITATGKAVSMQQIIIRALERELARKEK